MAMQVASLFASIGADTSGLQKGLKGAENQINKTAQGIKKSGESFNFAAMATGFNQALEIVNKLGDAIKVAYETAREGAQLEYARQRFDNLTNSIGTTSRLLLDDMRLATKGTISDFELMGSASDLMSLGLAKSHNEVIRLTTVSGALGMNMNQLVLALTNQTTARFDQLGISVDGFKEKVKSLEDAGMSAGDAFKEAFIVQAEDALGLQGSMADMAIGDFMRMEAAFKNFKDSYLEGVSKDIAPATNMMSETFTVWANRFNANNQFDAMIEKLEAAGVATAGFKRRFKDTKNFAGWIEDGEAYNELLADMEFRLEATTEGTQRWADVHDRVWTSLDNTTSSTKNMSEAALAHQMRLNEWRTSLAQTAQTLREDLAGAYATVAEAEMSWRQGVGGDLKSKLDEEFENKRITLDKYKSSLDILDSTYGTNYVMQFEMKMELDDLFKTLLKNPEEFEEKAKAFEEVFMPLDTSVQNAMVAVGNLQKKLLALERTYNTKVNIVIATYGADAGVDLGIDLSGLGGSEGGGAVIPELKAMGGYGLSGQPYIVGEAGPELFIPDVNGRVYSNASSSAMLGGDNGDLLAALGKLPSASDIAMAVRDALLMAGA